MKLYEGLFVFSPSSGPDARTEELGAVESLIKRFKGNVIEKKDLGKKILGYAVQKSREAYVVVFNFEMETSEIPGLYAAVNLEERILKYMITVAPKPVKPAVAKPAKVYKKPTVEPAKT